MRDYYMTKDIDKKYTENVQELMLELFMYTNKILKKFKFHLKKQRTNNF